MTVEYLLSVTFIGPPEPDDPRPLAEQAADEMDCVRLWLMDMLPVWVEITQIRHLPPTEVGGLSVAPRTGDV